MKRRDFIAGFGAAAWPLAARAQQPALPVIGYLNSESLETFREYFAAFHRGLNEAGFVEGRNVAVEYRWAEGQNGRLPSLAADLVRRQVAVIATNNTASVLAARAATPSIPIVFLVGADPVFIGLVDSLNRPGGHLTGVSILNTEIAAKLLQMMHELVPTATSIAFLVNPTNANAVIANAYLGEIRDAAGVLGVKLLVFNASNVAEIDAAFVALTQQRAGGLVINGDAYFIAQRDRVIALAARHTMPTIYAYREFAAAGGLMSYGPSLPDGYRRSGVYVGRILKGEKPADLPVERSTRIELVINSKTAKTLGIEVPLSLLVRADDTIE